jgi:cobalamin biosynthesis Mg chelatase CobN
MTLTIRSLRALWSSCALIAALALVPPASAQGGADPSVDPNSPPGTEYQLPVEKAREDARGGGSGASGQSQAPLFGEGVQSTKPGASGKGTAGKNGTGKAADAASGDSLGVETPKIKTLQAQVPAADSGGVSSLAIAGGAVGVLLVGGLAGLLWRRRSASS